MKLNTRGYLFFVHTSCCIVVEISPNSKLPGKCKSTCYNLGVTTYPVYLNGVTTRESLQTLYISMVFEPGSHHRPCTSQWCSNQVVTTDPVYLNGVRTRESPQTLYISMVFEPGSHHIPCISQWCYNQGVITDPVYLNGVTITQGQQSE